LLEGADDACGGEHVSVHRGSTFGKRCVGPERERRDIEGVYGDFILVDT